jgi:hypothetical protein
MNPAYAQLVGHFTASTERFVQESAWVGLNWHASEKPATRLPKHEADSLVQELEVREPGPTYEAVRDSTGEANLPPYGLDNWIVKRTGNPT